MTSLRRFASAVVFLAFACPACITSASSSDEAPRSTLGGSQAAPPAPEPKACYADTRTGCQDVSWSQVEQLLDFAFAGRSTYFGYDEASARSLAKEIYETGSVAEAGVSAFRVRTTAGRTSRVVVSVRDESGKALRGLTASSFVVANDAGTTGAALRAVRLGDARPEDVKLRLSTVLDDSGSISDCDAQFVADGVGTFFDLVPPVVTSELRKFSASTTVHLPFTADRAALSESVRARCTDRTSTALWDATREGLEAVSATVEEGELPAVVVFSDGLDNSSRSKFADVVAAARPKKVPVVVVGVGIADPFALTKLARETGGGFVYVPNGTRIVDAFRAAGTLLAEAYVVDLPAADAAPRSITVKLPSGKALVVDVPRP